MLWPNQPQTLTGIETLSDIDTAFYEDGPINLKPLQGLKHVMSGYSKDLGPAQSTSNPYRD